MPILPHIDLRLPRHRPKITAQPRANYQPPTAGWQLHNRPEVPGPAPSPAGRGVATIIGLARGPDRGARPGTKVLIGIELEPYPALRVSLWGPKTTSIRSALHQRHRKYVTYDHKIALQGPQEDVHQTSYGNQLQQRLYDGKHLPDSHHRQEMKKT